MRTLCLLMCSFSFAFSVPAFTQPNLRLPFMASETWALTRAYNTQTTHVGNDFYALDFVETGCTSFGKPIVACRSGRVIQAGANGDYGNAVTVDIGGGVTYKVAHMNAVVVKAQEKVLAGQVLGFCGNTGDVEGASCASHPGMHIHVVFRQNGNALMPEPISGYTGMVAGPNYTSQATGVFDREYDTNGGSNAFGNLDNPSGTYAGVHWYYAYNSSTLYRANNLANNCYIQNWTGSTYASCGIVYDALGGARRAYTVRNGFYHDGNGQGWSDLGGPTSSLGMPITNEYAYQGGARQDFQKGYLRYQQSHTPTEVWSTSYTAPGWTSSGWNNQYSYLFARAYERNGAANTVGIPDTNSHGGLVYDYGPYKRQDFSGGSFVNCSIFYDPNNATGNPAATNEALQPCA